MLIMNHHKIMVCIKLLLTLRTRILNGKISHWWWPLGRHPLVFLTSTLQNLNIILLESMIKSYRRTGKAMAGSFSIPNILTCGIQEKVIPLNYNWLEKLIRITSICNLLHGLDIVQPLIIISWELKTLVLSISLTS